LVRAGRTDLRITTRKLRYPRIICACPVNGAREVGSRGGTIASFSRHPGVA